MRGRCVSSINTPKRRYARGVANDRLDGERGGRESETTGETSDLEGGGLRSQALGILGRLYGAMGSEGEAHGILVGGWAELALFTAINSLPLSANRLLPLACPLLRSPSTSTVVARLAPFPSFPTLLRLIGCGIGRLIDARSLPDSSRGWTAFSELSLSSMDDCGLASTVFAFFFRSRS